jgi:hypothetical protein
MRDLVRTVTSLHGYDHPDWLQRGGRILGACNRLEAEECLFPGSTRYRKLSNRRGHGAGGRGIFRGGGWNDMLVVPFWHLPGLLSAFLFIGRRADAAQGDFVFKPLQPRFQCGREAGIQNLDGMRGGPHPQLGDTVFVLPDVTTAIAAQLGWMKSSLSTPPIVATFEDSNAGIRTAWSRLPEREIVFLSPQFDLAVLLQAKRARAPIAVNSLSKDELRWNLARNPLDWLSLAKRYARPWRTALQDRLSRLPQQEAETLLMQVGFDWPQMRDFIQDCPRDLKERLESVLNSPLFPRQTRTCTQTVTERDDALLLEPSQEVLANCVLRIEQTLVTTDKRVFYRGHVRFQGEQLPFVERSTVIERGVFAWARKLLRNAGKGPLIYRRSQSRNFLLVAERFHKPEFFTQVDTVGYRPAQLRFSFPRFSMTFSGEVHEPLPLIARGDVPAANLEPPQTFIAAEVEALSAVSAETMVLWAMCACLMDRLVIGSTSRGPSGIALVGRGAEVMGREAARLLGCIETRLPPRQRTRVVVKRLRSAFGRHDWPPFVSGRVTPALKAWLLDFDARNCIVPLDWHTGCVAAMHGGWHVICYEGAPGTLESLRSAAAKLIPAYFQDLAQRHFIYPLTRPCWIKGLLKDMAEWFERCGGDARAVRAATKVLTGDRRYAPWRHFLDMIARLLGQGEIDIIDQGDSAADSERPAIVYCKASGSLPASVRVPKYAVNELLEEKKVPLFGVFLVEKSFKDAGVLLGDVPEGSKAAWILPREWWDDQMRLRPQWRRARPEQALWNPFALPQPEAATRSATAGVIQPF